MELWTLPVTISEIVAEDHWDEEYVNDGDGGSTQSYRYWEELDEVKLSDAEIPYIGEEDEVNPEVLIPAIKNFLDNNGYLYRGTYIEEDKGGLSYTAYYDSNHCPYLRIHLG